MTVKGYAVLSGCVTLLLVLCAFRLGQATTTVRFDAAWWSDLTQSAKLAAVQGVIDGYDKAYPRGVSAGRSQASAEDRAFEETMLTAYFTGERAKYLSGYRQFRITSINNGFLDRALDKAAKAVDKANAAAGVSTDYPSFELNFGTYTDGITHFYENHPTKASWSPALVMDLCLSSRPSRECNT